MANPRDTSTQKCDNLSSTVNKVRKNQVEIFGIDNRGKITLLAKANNAEAGSMHICRTLSAKYRCPFDPFGLYRARAIGDLFGSPKMSEQDSVVLGFTFDRVWVKRENIDRLVQALTAFWEAHSTFVTLTGEELPAPPTIPKIIKILSKAAGDQKLKGVCFNHTSVAPNLWTQPNANKNRAARFDFDVNLAMTDETQPWELFETLHRRRLKRPKSTTAKSKSKSNKSRKG